VVLAVRVVTRAFSLVPLLLALAPSIAMAADGQRSAPTIGAKRVREEIDQVLKHTLCYLPAALRLGPAVTAIVKRLARSESASFDPKGGRLLLLRRGRLTKVTVEPDRTGSRGWEQLKVESGSEHAQSWRTTLMGGSRNSDHAYTVGKRISQAHEVEGFRPGQRVVRRVMTSLPGEPSFDLIFAQPRK
jgi:hypothetical protein